MSRGIGTPPAGRPAFAVGRDARGLLIARRAPALGRFAVGKVGDVLELGARPITGHLWNYCPNPRFAVNVTDGWQDTGVVSRVTTSPHGLPDGFDAAAQLYYGSAGTLFCAQYVDETMRQDDYLAVDFHAMALAAGSYVQWVAWDGVNVIDSRTLALDNLGSWYWADLFISMATMPTEWRVSLIVPAASNTPEEASFITGVRVTPYAAGDLEYRDGDSPGWEWTGTPHNSASRGTV